MEVPLYSLAERNGHRLPAAAPAIVRKAGVSGGPAVEITHLRKAYGNVVAVDDVSLSVPQPSRCWSWLVTQWSSACWHGASSAGSNPPQSIQERQASMASITIARGDVAPEEVIQALRAGLGARYHVLPETQASHTLRTPRPDEPAAIVVGIGSSRLWCTKVRIGHRGDQTQIQVAGPPRPPLIWLINALSITRKVHRVLQGAAGLGRPAAGPRNRLVD
jgi:hypothetical protein